MQPTPDKPETRQLASEIRLLSENELYRYQVRESAQYAMFAIAPDGNIQTWNAGVKAILGYDEDEWVGQPAFVIFTPQEHAREVCEAEMNVAAERGFSSDVRWHRRKNGTELFAHGFMTAIRDEAGVLLGYSKMLSDETANKQLQDSLTESNMALEKFAYVASHDLKEPLRTIGAFTQLIALRYGATLEDDANKLLDQVVNGTRRLSAMIQDLLEYAQVQTEIDRPSSVSLDQDLETALTLLQGAIDECKATVTHDPLPTLEADQGQMVRLFQNLVSNSIKYRRQDVAPVIHVSAEKLGSAWVITVADNGIGFKPEETSDLFLPFRRLHKDEYPGTGIGLAICRRIVENHGGRIWAVSQPGQGAKFSFSLPCKGITRPKHTPPVTQGF
jgi:PAS domain S-box-containing protein